jgi:putative ATP-dependent endonuclease of the OLD family
VHITKIIIDQFCSIEHAEFFPSQFNVMVGQNNHGKTNVFEALNWFFTNKGDISKFRFGQKGDKEISVEVEFTDVQKALSSMKNDKNRTSIAKVIGDQNTIRTKRTSLDPRVRKVFDQNNDAWLDKNPTGFDTAFNDFLPVLQYVDTKTPLNDVTKYSKTSPVGSMLSGVLTALLENSQPYNEFRQKFEDLFTAPESDVRVELDKIGNRVTIYMEKQFPDCAKVSFQITEPAFEELLKGCTTEIDDGIRTDAGEKGDGMQRALMLAILQTYSDFRKNGDAKGKQFLFLIDEAELHLHPAAQRNLKMALRDISANGDQVFINTHSSVLVADDFPEQKVFCVEKTNGKSNVTFVTPAEKPAVIYELLGGSPGDLLLPRNFLIVEGKSDQIFIRAIIDRFYQDKPPIQIIFSEGDFEKQRRSMDAINAVYSPLCQNPIYRRKLVILCDHPHPSKQTDYDAFIGSYPELIYDHRIQVLPVQSLEEYYPTPHKKTAAEVADLGQHLGLKRELARHVGKLITEAEFKQEMSVIKTALDRCWENAYS